MKNIFSFHMGVTMAVRMIWWQSFLGIWSTGESGLSGFLAPIVPQAMPVEGDFVSILEVEEERIVKSPDVRSEAARKPLQETLLNQTQKQEPLSHEASADSKEALIVEVVDVSVPTMLDEEGWVYKKRTVRPKSKSKEGRLISFMQKFAAPQPEIDCVIDCRYGEQMRQSWKHCLQHCVQSFDKRQSLLKMLPEEDRDAKALHYEVPPEFQDDLKRIKTKYKMQERHGEL
mmetsp:Transcript_68659/g.107378  ORF Transcript_68659/g.107378 Transcript_68659/m.107378 type:complete len:230 (+) Transcript_68659:56-745(+)